jgi:hypothetical protein
MSRLIRLAGVHALVVACLPVASAAALSYPVETNANAGAGSLRAAILEANAHTGADSIPIEVTGTIELEEKLPVISGEVTIAGPGAGALTIERTVSTAFRIFEFTSTDATVSGLTISGGKDHWGAGIFNTSGSLTLVRVAVSGNQAFFEGSEATVFAAGGGIVSSGPLTLRESVVSGNSAIVRGGENQAVAVGGGIEASGALTIERSTISGNSAESYAEEEASTTAEAGGLLSTGGPAAIRESTISGNSAHATEGQSWTIARGGGMAVNALTLTGTTVTGNSVAVEENGSLLLVGGANIRAEGTVSVRDTIVADPLGDGSSCDTDPPGSGALDSGGFNLDEDGSCGFGDPSDLVSAAAGLDPVLRDNGGPTPTHALLPGSIAIDRGNSFGSGLDQRGLPRPSDFPDVSNKEGGDGADIGAFELQAPRLAAGGPAVVTEQPADKTPPNTRIVSGPPRNTYKRKAKFRFASSEAQSSFQCKLDKKPWRGCANPFKRTVKPGRHVFKVRAIDRFGNVDPSPAHFGWRVKPLS